MGRADPEIIDAVLAGDREAFGCLVERHGPPVWSGIARLLGNREDAREVFQETFTRAFERLGSLREPGRLRSWLLAIALNQARARLRRPLALQVLEPDDARAADLDRTAPPASAAAETRERSELLLEAVAELPPRQRQVVELRLHGELSHAEIADALDISEDASRANYYQGLRRLKARLEPRLEPER